MDLGLDYLNNEDQKRLRVEFDKNPPKAVETAKEDSNTVIEENQKDNIHQGNTSSSSDDSKISSPYVPFAKHLAEEGVILGDDLDDFDGTLESLVDKIKGTIDYYRKNDLENLPENARDFLEMVKTGVPLERAQSIIKDKYSIEKLTENEISSDEDVQKSIVRQYLKKIGTDDDEIEDQIEYLDTINKLESKAMSLHKKLKDDIVREKESEKQKAVALEEFRKKEIEKQLADVRKTIEDTKEIVPGLSLSKKDRETIYKNLTTPYSLDDNKNPMTFVQAIRQEDPVKFEIILNYLASKGVFKGDFSGILNTAKSKVVEDLERTLSREDSYGKGVASVVKQKRDEREQEETKDILASIPGSLADLLNYKPQ